MKIGAIVMLVVALVLGGLSVFAARNWIERQIAGNVASQKQQMSVVKIVVARTQLHFGDKIKDEHLIEITWPKESVPEGSFASTRDVLEGDRPRVALRRIEANEPILKSKISGFGGRATLSAVLKGGRRAVTIRVNDVTGVSGFLLPGDRVDILISRGGGRRSGSRKTSLLLQDIRVLGVGQLASERSDKPVVVRTLTVEATPREAQKLVLAQQVGKLSMVLRPVTERTIVHISAVTDADLTQDQSDPARLRPPKKVVKKGVVKKKEKGAAVVVVKAKPRKRVTLPKRSPFTTIGITRGLRRSTQRVPYEKRSGKRVLKAPVPPAGFIDTIPRTDRRGIPVPFGSSTQSGMVDGSLAGEAGQGIAR